MPLSLIPLQGLVRTFTSRPSSVAPQRPLHPVRTDELKAVLGASVADLRSAEQGKEARNGVEAGAGDHSSLRASEAESTPASTNVFEEGQLTEAVEALDLLLHQRSYVDNSVFYLVLKRCIEQKDLALGRRVHALALKGGYESNAFLANHIIRMYACHGKLEEATQVFSKVREPNSFMWASIISAHAEHGQATQAINLYRRLCKESTVKPNSYIIVAVLKACAACGDVSTAKEVHADIVGSSGEPNVFVGSCLVDMYAKCGSLADARKVFDKLSSKNVVAWTAMIAGYAQHGFGREALALYADMQKDGVTPADRVMFMCLLQACATVGDLHQGKKLHRQIQQSKLENDIVVGNCLVNMYAKCGTVEEARRVFDNIRTKNVGTWTAMITGYVQQGLGEEALKLYASMQQEGITVANQVTISSLLKACASIGALGEGIQLHVETREMGLEDDPIVGSSLVDMYAKCGRLEDARTVFDRLPSRDVVTWTAMIAGYAQVGLGLEALGLYGNMQDEGISPTDITFVCLVKACASVGALRVGKELHAQILERGYESNLAVGNSLVDMYAKCGRLEDARKVLDSMTARDVVTWTALLNGYADHSNGQMAMQCFKEMLQQGVAPNGATFTCLLVACSHEGLVDEGQQYFKMMVDEHGIVPTIDHYNCMVDLLGRSGRLDEAEDILQTMPFENDAVGWRSLLCACKSHGDTDRARRCFDRLVKLEPEGASAYALMATIYWNAARWSDADKVESLRKVSGAWKKPARAYIEVQSKVHEFTVGEETANVSSKLRSMNSRLQDDGGHVPQTELVLKGMPEMKKEDALCGHAEKLALAYGLLNTPEGTTLLVTKNLRMCNDCHSSTKIMSRVEKREIIVRDAHRVHHFEDGVCSCGDRQ